MASTKGFSRKRSNRQLRDVDDGVARASTKGFSRKRSNARCHTRARKLSFSLNEGLLSEEKQSRPACKRRGPARSRLNEGLLSEEKQFELEPLASKLFGGLNEGLLSEEKQSCRRLGHGRQTEPQRRASLGREAIDRWTPSLVLL